MLSFSLRHGAFFLALLLYGIFSSPTPDNPGVAEMSIALLLIASIGFNSFLQIFSASLLFQRTTPPWIPVGTIALFYFLIVPSVTGALGAGDVPQMIRDIVPMLYGFLPLFLWPVMQKNTLPWRKLLLAGLLAIGTLFALRYFVIIGKMPWQVGRKTYHDTLLYLPLSPEVLFSAIAFAAMGAPFFFRKKLSLRAFLLCILCAAMSALCFAALSGMLLRAAIALGLCAIAVIALSYFRRAPLRLLFGCLIAAAVVIAVPKPFLQVKKALIEKAELTGLNQRDAEFRAAITPLLDDPVATWLGLGWGAHILSPAVGGLRVPYTHSFFSYLWVKTGLFGLFLMIAFIAALLWSALRNRNSWNGLILAACAPLLLSLTLYTSYKTLGFGLLLSFIAAHGKENENKIDFVS